LPGRIVLKTTARTKANAVVLPLRQAQGQNDRKYLFQNGKGIIRFAGGLKDGSS
jgi:hypothetical protein